MSSADAMILAAMKQAEEAMTSHNRGAEPGKCSCCGWDFGEDYGGTLDLLRLAIQQFQERLTEGR